MSSIRASRSRSGVRRVLAIGLVVFVRKFLSPSLSWCFHRFHRQGIGCLSCLAVLFSISKGEALLTQRSGASAQGSLTCRFVPATAFPALSPARWWEAPCGQGLSSDFSDPLKALCSCCLNRWWSLGEELISANWPDWFNLSEFLSSRFEYQGFLA